MTERRGTARQSPEDIKCSGGRIIDFSVRGMRICSRRPWAEGERRSLVVRKGLRSATVTAVCVWTRRDGAFRHVTGLAFAEAEPELMANLAAMLAMDDTPMRRAA